MNLKVYVLGRAAIVLWGSLNSSRLCHLDPGALVYRSCTRSRTETTRYAHGIVISNVDGFVTVLFSERFVDDQAISR